MSVKLGRKTKKNFILFGTGHRPDKLLREFNGGPLTDWLFKQTCTKLLELKPTLVYCGMALGFDQILAHACCSVHVPFIAAIPFEGQEKVWPDLARHRYHTLLAAAKEVVPVSPPPYSPSKMQTRNEFMVDRSHEGLSCWNGDEYGGTYNCLQYARTMRKTVHNIDPRKYVEDIPDDDPFNDANDYGDMPC